MRNNIDIFNEIYEKNIWGYKSGEGSDPENAKEWIDIVNSFIEQNNIKTILDLGCGDWRIGKCLNLDNIFYTGIEVSSVIFNEIISNKKENINFINSDIVDIEYPEVDLILIKDVLQHMSSHQISIVLDKMAKSSRYALISNDFDLDGNNNKDTTSGDWQSLDLNVEPFNKNFSKVLDFKSGSQIKRVYLYKR